MPDFTFDFSTRNRADDLIDDLIEKVLAAYPAERLERIKARSEATWKDMGAPFKDRIPYILKNITTPEQPEAPDDATEIQCEMIGQLKWMLNGAEVDDEYYPGFPSGLEQVTVPSLFMCVTESLSHSSHVKPVIKTPSDVYSLPGAEIREGYMCHTLLSKMAYKHQRTGGRISVYMTDIQGPFSSAAQIWGIEDFLGSLDEYRNEADHLLSLCTDAIIKYFYAMYDAVGGDLIPIHCPYLIWVPKDCGVAASDDFLMVNSERVFREFSMPYLERIGEEFGGITTHSCGCVDHTVKSLSEMKTLKAINFGSSETHLMQFANKCNPNLMLIVHKTGATNVGDLPLLSIEEHIRLCRDVHKATGIRLYASAYNNEPPADAGLLARWERAARL